MTARNTWRQPMTRVVAGIDVISGRDWLLGITTLFHHDNSRTDLPAKQMGKGKNLANFVGFAPQELLERLLREPGFIALRAPQGRPLPPAVRCSEGAQG